MLTLLCSFVVAQDDGDDLGTDKLAQTGMKFLSFSPDARAAALGGAITAKTGGASSLFYNPAGMARLEGMNVVVGQLSGLQIFRIMLWVLHTRLTRVFLVFQ